MISPRLSRRQNIVGKQKTDLLQGTLDMLILKALSLGPMHGFGVGQRIMQMSEDALRVEEGSLYPALYRIEQQGFVTSEWGVSENNQRAKFYKLMRAAENVRRGMTPEEAERAALRSFGSWARVKEACRDVKGGGVMETLWQDL